VVEKTTEVKSLKVADGATLKAPDGKSLTMTVDGVETGQYTGAIVLRVS
jgi:hypothetical protein